MQGRLLGIGESISTGWQTFTRYAGVLIGAYVVYFVVVAGAGYIPVVGPFVSLFIAPPFVGGIIIMGLKAVREQTPEFGELFSGFRDYWRWMGVYWLFVVIILAAFIPAGVGALIAYLLGTFKHSPAAPSEIAGVVIMVLTGLISFAAYFVLAIRYMFAWYEAADGVDIVESFKRSAEITEGRRWELLGIAIVLGLFSIAGVIACGVGVILTSLIAYLAYMHIYVNLKGDQPEPPLLETPPSPA